MTTNISTQQNVDDDVVAAIYSGQTQVIRRCEIYEADGVTAWNPSRTPRLIGGTVSVSTGGNIRRNIDMTLDNADGGIDHNPDGGLWYDKVIKVFRGVQYPNRRRVPNVGLLGFSLAQTTSIAKFLARIGVTNFVPLTVSSTAPFVLPANVDVMVAWSNGVDFDATTAAVIAQVYGQGGNVMTVNNFATTATVPLITATTTRSGSAQWNLIPSGVDNPFADYNASFMMKGVSGETLPYGLRSTARFISTAVYGSTTVYPMFYETNALGGRWVHIHPTVTDAITPASSYSQFMTLLPSLLNYLYLFGDDRIWETQVGEFMIDKITEPRFPYQINITGRDYGKRLDRYKTLAAASYKAGTSVDYVFRYYAGVAGISKLKINSGGLTIPSAITIDKGSSALDVFDQFSEATNCEYYFDRYGYLVLRPFLDPTLSPVSVNLKGGDPSGGNNLVDFTKTSDDSEVYNVIVVSGLDSDGTATHSAIAVNGSYDSTTRLPAPSATAYYNNQSGSPTSTNRIGLVIYFYDSDTFTSDAQCLAYAKRLLATKALESYNVDFSSLVFPWAEVGEIVQSPTFADEEYPDRYLLTDLSIPLDLNPMSGTAKRISIVSS